MQVAHEVITLSLWWLRGLKCSPAAQLKGMQMMILRLLANLLCEPVQVHHLHFEHYDKKILGWLFCWQIQKNRLRDIGILLIVGMVMGHTTSALTQRAGDKETPIAYIISHCSVQVGNYLFNRGSWLKNRCSNGLYENKEHVDEIAHQSTAWRRLQSCVNERGSEHKLLYGFSARKKLTTYPI